MLWVNVGGVHRYYLEEFCIIIKIGLSKIIIYDVTFNSCQINVVEYFYSKYLSDSFQMINTKYKYRWILPAVHKVITFGFTFSVCYIQVMRALMHRPHSNHVILHLNAFNTEGFPDEQLLLIQWALSFTVLTTGGRHRHSDQMGLQSGPTHAALPSQILLQTARWEREQQDPLPRPQFQVSQGQRSGGFIL